LKWKILIVAILLISAAVGYKFYSDTVEEAATPTYETEKVVRMDLTKQFLQQVRFSLKTALKSQAKLRRALKKFSLRKIRKLQPDKL